MSADNNKSIEIGLKTEVKRQVGLKQWEQKVGNHCQTHLVNAWKKLLLAGMEDIVKDMIWDYCLTTPDTLWFNLNSAIFGIYSTIGEYENKRGNKSLAHFTENGHYLGSVLKLGNKPIGYEGNFRLSKARFQLDITKLDTLTHFNDAYILQKLFYPINVCVMN
jgi:hypothetical protein